MPDGAFLELVDLVLAVSQLLQDTREFALVLGADLGAANGLVQSRGATNEDLDVVLLGLGKNGLQKLLVDVALAASPALRGVVKDIEGAESLGVGVLQVLELLLQKNVLLLDVSKDQGDLGLVIGVLEDLTSQLVHGGNSGSTSDQADVVVLISFPRVLGKRSLKFQALVNVQAVDVFRHRAVGVLLDNKLQVTGLVCKKG